MNFTALLLCTAVLVCTGFCQARTFEQELDQPEAPENETEVLDVGHNGHSWHRWHHDYGWKHGWYTYKHKCYYFSRHAEDWQTALMSCRWIGGYLVKISHPQENEFLRHIAHGTGVSYWTGGNDLARSGHWFWAYPFSPMRFTDWYPGQPTHPTAYKCVELYSGWAYRWHNTYCHYKRNFICEKHRC